ncbi:MAG: DUF6273 domain-containing protein [Acutalibacteraceae bacterium]|nr:DUF6273 domain-containing protein [Acutalibacteraceae bacterium]
MKKTLIILLTLVMLCIATACKDNDIEEVVNPVVIGEMAGHSQHYRVYIKENDKYIPYVVVTSDYNHNTLLMREKPLDEKMAMNNQQNRANYYATSDLDDYLNNSFIDSFSDTMQDIINNTRIEITTNDILNIKKKSRGTEFITRKIFLLSANEWGIKSASAVDEGKRIAKVENFMPADNEWLRTSETYSYDTFWAVGNNVYNCYGGQTEMCVRPVFTVPFDTEVEKSDMVIKGKAVYIIQSDNLIELKETESEE